MGSVSSAPRLQCMPPGSISCLLDAVHAPRLQCVHGKSLALRMMRHMCAWSLIFPFSIAHAACMRGDLLWSLHQKMIDGLCGPSLSRDRQTDGLCGPWLSTDGLCGPWSRRSLEAPAVAVN